MVKKLNPDALMIKKLIKKGYKQCDISRILGIKKEKVSYWARHDLKDSQKKCKKLKDIYIRAIQRWANNKVTSSMSSRKIASKINSILKKRKEVDRKGKPITVHFTTVNNYLKQYFGKPRKIRKVFFMSEENKKKRVEFCKRILNMNIMPEQIFFTDESRIELSSFSNDWIRLDPQVKWSDNTYRLINRPEKKFPLSLTIAAGINYYGLSKLIFLDGTMNEFAYGQALLFYKDDIEEIEKKEKIRIIFEQDGASSHTSSTSRYLLNTFFKEDGWFQNPPNSPDLAYPIENLWAIIKPRVRRREPKSIEELKQFLNEEWSSIPIALVQNLCKGYLEKVKKILDLNGGRIEPEFRERRKKKSNIYGKNLQKSKNKELRITIKI